MCGQHVDSLSGSALLWFSKMACAYYHAFKEINPFQFLRSSKLKKSIKDQVQQLLVRKVYDLKFSYHYVHKTIYHKIEFLSKNCTFVPKLYIYPKILNSTFIMYPEMAYVCIFHKMACFSQNCTFFSRMVHLS